jgi:glucose/arabinose dehydrogenase
VRRAVLLAGAAVAVLALGAGCSGSKSTRDTPTVAATTATSAATQAPAAPLRASFGVAFPALPKLDRPTAMLEVPGQKRMLVALQDGRIVSFAAEASAGELTTVHDQRQSTSRDGNEEGLLGLALDPDFAANGFIYVYFSAKPGERRTVLSRFNTTGRGADLRSVPGSELVLLTIPQPFSNHNGGQIGFGPDRMLYLGIGDGGSQGDPSGNGQDLKKNLLGSIIRIDVRGATKERPYAIPPDNPWAASANGERPETWAYGLRNPWRFSWDEAGRMIAGDVGQDAWEELDYIQRGANYGWNLMEGAHCYKPKQGCPMDGLTLPFWEYSHDGGACSITGGYAYRGKAIPGLGYVFGDYCTGAVWTIPALFSNSVRPQAIELRAKGPPISSFAEDLSGELYLLCFDGKIYRINP